LFFENWELMSIHKCESSSAICGRR